MDDDRIAEKFLEPVDPELFLWCWNIYCAAASRQMPVDDPGNKPVMIGGSEVRFTDNPMNRGIMAVTSELRGLGKDFTLKSQVMFRITQFHEIIQHRDEMGTWLSEGESEQTLEVSESLIKACARAKLENGEDNLHFVIPDVVRLAGEFDAAEQEEGAG